MTFLVHRIGMDLSLHKQIKTANITTKIVKIRGNTAKMMPAWGIIVQTDMTGWSLHPCIHWVWRLATVRASMFDLKMF